jgi:RimJ/RimL family protein N-acetyltransferase
VRAHLYAKCGWTQAVSYIDPKNLDSIRLAERLGCVKDKEAATIDGNDAVYRHPSPERLKSGQIADGIEMEINHYCDPLFKPKGMPID